MIRQLFLRILLLAPWVFLVWLIVQGIDDTVNIWVVFALLFILIPGAMFLNVVTYLAFQGHQALVIMRNMQKSRDVGNQKLKSENYADLPWWNPKKYKN